MYRYLVTGGAGFIGSALVKRLLEKGHQVVVLDNFSRGKGHRLPNHSNLTVIHGDIRNLEAVYTAMHDCDSVIHAAYVQGTQNFYTKPQEVLEVGVKGITNVLDACRYTGCKELILISSCEAYQMADEIPTDENVPLSVPDVLNPRYSYGGGKIVSELMVFAWARAGILDRVMVIRPHNVYGPDMGEEHVVPEFTRRFQEIREKHPYSNTCSDKLPFYIQGTGEETRSFCYIDDFTDAMMLVIEKGEHMNVYHLGSDQEITIKDLAKEMAKYFFLKIRIIPGILAKGSPPRRCPDITKIRQLGYEPKIPLGRGITDTLRWYLQHSKGQ